MSKLIILHSVYIVLIFKCSINNHGKFESKKDLSWVEHILRAHWMECKNIARGDHWFGSIYVKADAVFSRTNTDKITTMFKDSWPQLFTNKNNVMIQDVVPVARLEAFRALKLSKSESFRALKFSRLESFRVLKSSNLATNCRALNLSNLESFRALKASNLATGTTSKNFESNIFLDGSSGMRFIWRDGPSVVGFIQRVSPSV